MERLNIKLETKQDVLAWADCLFSALWARRDNHTTGIPLGKVVSLYGEKTAAMESFCRLLWGVFPALAGGNATSLNLSDIFRVIAEGTNPDHRNYWGNLTDCDQRCVEMAALGCGLAIADNHVKKYLTPAENENLLNWLNQLRDVELPRNNWSFFPIIVEMGLCLSGRPYSQTVIDLHFARLDSYYLGDGWYSDGHNRPRDYYNAMALHYYGLLYSKLMARRDPERCHILRERASTFALDYMSMFAENGSAIPFGRSLIYRFAQIAFWSAAAFAEIDTVPMGVIKGLVLRNLRWWQRQEMTDHQGILTVGYSYTNPMIAEDYNSPGSPYWSFKAFLVLILDESHPFWAAQETELPALTPVKKLIHAGQLVHRDRKSNHHYLLNAGQLPAKNYNNTESKYCKFAYSSLLGFNLERSRFGIELNACDSTLLLSEHDGYYRGRRASAETVVTEDYIFTHWHPWSDVAIKTWLLPLHTGHLRMHVISTRRELETVEGGFPIPVPELGQTRFDHHTGLIVNPENRLFSLIKDLSPACARQVDWVIAPPASNIIFPCCSGVPVLKQSLLPGIHVLGSFVNAGQHEYQENDTLPQVLIQDGRILIKIDDVVKLTISYE